jgi:hypothetical protein
MTIKEAIHKALEGGWDDANYAFSTEDEMAANPNFEWQYDGNVYLDPAFWQSLDKTLAMERFLKNYIQDGDYQPHWQELWHEFIDHLAKGGTPESFFAKLDNSK